MRTQLTRVALAAGFALALAFTLSCSSDVINESNDPSSYCGNSGGGGGSGGTFTDSRDGKAYNWVKIGTQVWMAENLNYNASGSKCYDNDDANCGKYGRLYNWNTAMNVCPTGWHLPSNAEWDRLVRYADGSSGTESPYDSETAGRYLKATSCWYGNGNGQNTYGFSALPGGYGNPGDSVGYYGSFGRVGYYGYWWSSEDKGSSYDAYLRGIYYDSEYVYYDYDAKYFLFSVRCVQD